MLKALEIAGFKSFADKTRFEFPEGITVIVGPNGSGKSNIVDAIKWVLGEQSAKSLRGKDMSDVIFKGGGSGARKPCNTAEATLVFDNSNETLPIDAPEVHITRRVYRSGEAEYLINNKPCRLKDIRDLCRGTGVGVDAYSLIEQGKVDRLLQANPKDRRAIFEEAAGISRFKAKKVEAQRRLERVEQNLLRLSDIVDEVESRLRSVRAQASKAQRYREYTERLQQLRTQVGLTDWRKFSEKLQAIERELDELRQSSHDFQAEADDLETRHAEAESTLERANDTLRETESRFLQVREQIAKRTTVIESGRDRCQDFHENLARHRAQWKSLSGRAGDLYERLKDTGEKLAAAEAQYAAIRATLEEHETAANQLAETIERRREENAKKREQYIDRMRAAAMLGNQASSFESQRNAAQSAAEHALRQLEEVDRICGEHHEKFEESQSAERRLTEEAEEKAAALETAEIELAENRRVLARRQEELAVTQGKHSGATQRAKVLEDLERQHAGLSSGVHEILAEAEKTAADGRPDMHGMVADLIETSVEVAPMIDAALGEIAQHVVVQSDRIVQRLEAGEIKLSGRIGLIRLDAVPATSAAFATLPFGSRDLDGRPGVIGRADRLVRTKPQFEPLIRHLLSDTWCVETLADGLHLSRSFGKDYRFVTLAGELLNRDGTLIAGPQKSTTTIVSRRSELRTLQLEIVDLQRRITAFLQEITRLQENIDRQDRQNKLLVDAYKNISTALADQRVRTRTMQERHEHLSQQQRTLRAEHDAAQKRFEHATTELEKARAELAKVEKEVADADQSVRDVDREIEQLEKQHQQHARQATAAKIEIAKSEQQLDGLRVQLSQFEADQQERDRTVQGVQYEIATASQRIRQAERSILQATSELAELYLEKDQVAQLTQASIEQRQQLNRQRSELSQQLESVRRKARKVEEQLHRRELVAGELQHERTNLANRLRDDYGIEIAELEAEVSAEEENERAEVEAEITDLRSKINRIGAVNLDALDELDDLEERFAALSGQFQDLTQAKESLERIIQKINSDSRRLFLETLEAIRANFQVLYRKAFGGGKADIVLEEGKDVLECGVDILATPPGKPSFNNSLLSGGEKALTAVSLLLAIFEFRPSPFCILDEVDAPFDEANVGRFIDVLKDFLDWTKFVIVTHSKKTMTAATTLYGITMQESGVSKRVSVCFEDVSEDGEISEEAIQRAAESNDDEQAA